MIFAALLRVIIYILLVIIAIRILVWIFYPFLSAKPKDRNEYRKARYKKEGDITIDYIPKKDKKYGNATGDYTEYEEVK